MEKAAWDRGEREVQPTLYIGPFEVSPTFLDLQPMDTFTMTVTFRPEVAGPATGRLVLVCDNCQLKELTLAGSGCCVVVNIESVDGQPCAAPRTANAPPPPRHRSSDTHVCACSPRVSSSCAQAAL